MEPIEYDSDTCFILYPIEGAETVLYCTLKKEQRLFLKSCKNEREGRQFKYTCQLKL